MPQRSPDLEWSSCLRKWYIALISLKRSGRSKCPSRVPLYSVVVVRVNYLEYWPIDMIFIYLGGGRSQLWLTLLGLAVTVLFNSGFLSNPSSYPVGPGGVRASVRYKSTVVPFAWPASFGHESKHSECWCRSTGLRQDDQ